jgi:hypothetical protein
VNRDRKAESTGFTPGGEDSDDDPQLSSLRSVWLAMPDEDPPARGMAELMAAARVKAEEMAKPSLWQRVMAALRRPPVLAFATVVVLVGGAALIGQRGDKMEAEPPSLRAEQDRALEQSMAPAGSAVSAAAPESTGAAAAAPAEEVAPEPALAPPPAPTKAEKAPVNRRTTGLKRDEAKPTSEAKKTAPKPAAPTRAAPRADDTLNLHEGYDRGGSTDKRAYESEAVVGGATAADSTAPAPPSTTAPSTEDSAPKTTSSPAGSSRATRTAQYLAQAKSAAARGDCAAARALMKRVANEDAAAHEKALASDASLSKCLAQ